MPILQNAVDSIVLGTEDFRSSDSRRLLSCARNIQAGMLLLFKCKLAELSPPGSKHALVMQRVLPVLKASGGIQWEGKGKRTIDVQEIQERFDNLGIAVDWGRVHRVTNYRNEIEHLYSNATHDAARALIADSFIVIRDFIRIHLHGDPLNILGAETYNTLTGVAEVYNKEKNDLAERLALLEWLHESACDALVEHHCEKCGSGLIDVIDLAADRESAQFKCMSCGERWDAETLICQAVEDYFGYDNFRSVKDGGEPATTQCPNCCHDTYLLEDDVCLYCGESTERTCTRCGNEIPGCELDGSGLCSWCAHMMSKDD